MFSANPNKKNMKETPLEMEHKDYLMKEIAEVQRLREEAAIRVNGKSDEEEILKIA